MSGDLVQILEGNTFVVSDARGDIEASPTDPTGLFANDTRFLSTWVLTIDGQRLNALSTDDLNYFETRFFLVPGTGTVYIDANPHRRRQRLRRPLRGQGCLEEEGRVPKSRRRGHPRARVPARNVRARDTDPFVGTGVAG